MYLPEQWWVDGTVPDNLQLHVLIHQWMQQLLKAVASTRRQVTMALGANV